MNEKRCGTCRWWKSHALLGWPENIGGECEYEPVLPECFNNFTEIRYPMNADQGESCECWEDDKTARCLAWLKLSLPSHISIPTDPYLGAIGEAIRILEGEDA